MNCLYNGVPLPTLPDWDKITYPYARIGVYDSTYRLIVSSLASKVPADGTVVFITGKTYSVENGEWVECVSDYKSYKVIWANYDVYYADDLAEVGGSLYLAASDPVPVLTRSPAAMALGWLAGMAVRRMRGQKQPVACLYNSVELPILPNVDGLPCVWIVYSAWGKLGNLYFAESVEYGTSESGSRFLKASTDNFRYYRLDSANGVWNEVTTSVTVCDIGTITWANFDVLNADGSTYLAASEPVPVYE